MRASLGAALVLFLSAVHHDAAARPGGGQSFRSGSSSSSSGSSSGSSGSSRSSSGSSWGSSGSSRSSSSGSSWSWGTSGSSRSSSSSGSGHSPSYGGGYDGRAAERQRRETEHLLCTSRCVMLPDEEGKNCVMLCDASRDRPLASGSVDVSDPPSYVKEKPLSRLLWIPGVLLGVVAVGGLGLHLQRRRDEQMWASIGDEAQRFDALRREQELAKQRFTSVAAALAELRSTDESFSWTLFEDFLHVLYVEAQKARGRGNLELMKPWLSFEARVQYRPILANEVKAIIVGSLETRGIWIDEAARKVRVEVAFMANYTEVLDDREQSYYAREVWTLARGADVKSRPPKRARTLDCGNCGAPLEKLMGTTCEHCGAAASAGSRDWEVEAIQVEAREPRGPMLTGTTEEEGTDLPTLVAPDVQREYAALSARDPGFSWSAFVQRLELVFRSFHVAWSSQELGGVRPFLSDNLFETQTYWVEAYRAEQLRNLTEDAQIVSAQLSRVVRDRFYDAITVRVFAQCKDYTLDRHGTVVGGSREALRRYSEYWTFIRSAARTGPAGSTRACPSCGASIEHIDVAGACSSCQAKVTSGEFDWILSRIEQDEVYRL